MNTDGDVSTEIREETTFAAEEPRNTTSDEIDDDDDDMSDFFMEITPESIDALAAETRSELASESKESRERWESEDPRESIESTEAWQESWVQREPIDMFPKPRKKPRWDIDVEKTRFKSIKLDNAATYSPQASTSKRNMVGNDWIPPTRETWMAQKAALKEKFPEGWNPMKKLSPEAQAGIRALNAQYPGEYSTAALANHFRVSPEAIRRILRTNWVPKPEEEADRERRWFKRGMSVWGRYAELGIKPPRKWREEGIGKGKPEWKKREKPVVTTSRPGNAESRVPETISLDDDMEDKIF